VSPQLDTTYSPILKGKAGELRALGELAAEERGALLPLIDGPPEGVEFGMEDEEKWLQIETVDEAVSGYATKIRAAWDSLSPCLVDLAGFDPSLRLADGAHPLSAFFAEARAVDLAAVPVTGLERDAAQIAAVREACEAWPPLGAAIRLRGPGLADLGTLASALTRLLGEIGLEPGEVDLLIDLGSLLGSEAERLAAALPGLITALPEPEAWRSVVLCSGAFPFELGSLVKKNETGELPRRDWQLWRELVESEGPARLPSFGDYGATRADWPSAFDPFEMSISGKIVYATPDHWVVVKGEDLKKDSRQYHRLARRLRQHPDFLAATHCSGEIKVIACAEQRDGPGNPGTWVTVATRHHIEVVSRQLASLA
jgi:Beta protein